MALTQEQFSAREASTYSKYAAMDTQGRQSAVQMAIAMMSQYESLHAYGKLSDEAITVFRGQGDAIVAGLFRLMADQNEITPLVCGMWAKGHSGRASLFKIPPALETAIANQFQAVYGATIANNPAVKALVRFLVHPVLKDPVTAVVGNKMADACRAQVDSLSKQLIAAGAADVVAAASEYYRILPAGEAPTFNWLSKYAESIPAAEPRMEDPTIAQASDAYEAASPSM